MERNAVEFCSFSADDELLCLGLTGNRFCLLRLSDGLASDIIDADNSLVATHCERFSKLGDGYELNIRGEDCELFCIGTAVCVNLTQRVKQPKLQTV